MEYTVYLYQEMIYKFQGILPEIHEDTFIAINSSIIGNVKIMKNCSIWFGAVLRGDIEEIVVEEGSNIQDNCVLHTGFGLNLIIGRNTTVGHQVTLHSCHIGEGSLIGMGSTILDGAIIGKHCLIGANSLVTQKTVIPDYSLVIGSPAKVKRVLTEDEVEGMKRNAEEYIYLMKEYRKVND